MRAKLLRVLPVAAALFVAAPMTVQAQPITYSFTGVGTGALGATTFTNASFSFTLLGDISNVLNPGATFCGGASNVPGNTNTVANLTAQFSIGGVGTGNFGSAYVFDNRSAAIAGFGTCLRNDLMGVVGGGTNAYDLRSSYGPQNGAVYFPNQFLNQITSSGNLTFSSASSVIFSATTTVSTVPEPSTYLLMASGLVAIGFLRRRRRA